MFANVGAQDQWNELEKPPLKLFFFFLALRQRYSRMANAQEVSNMSNRRSFRHRHSPSLQGTEKRENAPEMTSATNTICPSHDSLSVNFCRYSLQLMYVLEQQQNFQTSEVFGFAEKF